MPLVLLLEEGGGRGGGPALIRFRSIAAPACCDQVAWVEPQAWRYVDWYDVVDGGVGSEQWLGAVGACPCVSLQDLDAYSLPVGSVALLR
jgi:hypothetical protein